ncbi:conserved hypothetical protein [Frankia casuarinae]|uniref:Uncharacterized protein n=1 Tax=Frankia casuarinae (strain DSM 45818 / CECT 9043 / HFP020203 / CcI3) TaxID=106370 RepID=Q2JBZ2_FRACC|nr:conserved hypothetical protein [Frankia casuarinae]
MANWFPLVPRPRPPTIDRRQRLTEIEHLAHSAPGNARRTTNAAEALNKAALLASDCGLPDLAKDLCWRQFHVFDNAGPQPPALATAVLQPLINLGRLELRADDPDRAYTFFNQIHHAVRTSTAVVLDGVTVNPARLFADDNTLLRARRFTWTVLLGDGTRALARAGRWDDAVAHLHRHHGIGRRLLDGRQTLILASHLAGESEAARTALATSVTPTPWERAVAAVLGILCRHGSEPQAIGAALDDLRASSRDPTHPVFQNRLGLTLLDLATDATDQKWIASAILAGLRDGHDGRCAADALAHPRLQQHLSPAHRVDLVERVKTAGIQRPPPTTFRDAMTTATLAAERGLRDALAGPLEGGRLITRRPDQSAARGEAG